LRHQITHSDAYSDQTPTELSLMLQARITPVT
jgi:hypothetical protein